MREHLSLIFIGAMLATAHIASAQTLQSDFGISFVEDSIYTQNNPCEAPIEFKIGTLDTRFGISRNEFLSAVEQASDVWGSVADRKLFKYSSNGKLKVNLVYDARQQTTQFEGALHTSITETIKAADSIKEELITLKANFRTFQGACSDQLAQYSQAQDNYNHQVDYWNNAGGVPEQEGKSLAIEKTTLRDQGHLLEIKRQQLNQLSGEINALVNRYNSLINQANADVGTLNSDGLTGSEFEEGRYTKKVTRNISTSFNLKVGRTYC